MKKKIKLNRVSIFLFIICLIGYSTSCRNQENELEIFNSEYRFNNEFRFTRVNNIYAPIDSFYLLANEPKLGRIILDKSQGSAKYIINGLNLKINANTTISNLTVEIKDDRIIGIKSNNIKSSFCASSIVLDYKSNNIYKTIKFIETDEFSIGFHVATSIDTTTIRLIGTIDIL